MYKGIKAKIKNILPSTIWNTLKTIKHPIKSVMFRLTLAKTQKNHKVALEKVRIKYQKKEKVKVVFFLIFDSSWKYEYVYRLMKKSDIFEPVIIVVPYLTYGIENAYEVMSKAYTTFKNQGYNVINSWSEKTKQWLDVKKEISPDIVFFTAPYSYTNSMYTINSFLDTLTCYVQYSFHVSSLNQTNYNQDFHNFLWKDFCETSIHLEMAKENSRNKGVNAVITGYPGTDCFSDEFYKAKDVWKIEDKKIKRIIWSPHHTIDPKGVLGYSNFKKYSELMLDIVKNYKDDLQIAFKPHPLLYVKLCEDATWGKERTDAYYKKWNNLENGQLSDSTYVDLFLTSDALINDSGSFVAEYLYMNKPSLFCVSNPNIFDNFNRFGKLVLENHEKAYNSEDILSFVKRIVDCEKDPLSEKRKKFIEKYLIPPNKKMASANILDYIIEIVKK